MYPPDRSGREASEHTRLQYVDPRQREVSESFAAARSYQAGSTNQPNQPHQQAYGTNPLYDDRNVQTTTGNPTARTRGLEPTVLTRPGDNTSSESSTGSNPNSRTPLTRTMYWYCCNQGCANNGPYIEGMYANCIHGCGHQKCWRCPQQIVALRDRPAAYEPLRSKRH